MSINKSLKNQNKAHFENFCNCQTRLARIYSPQRVLQAFDLRWLPNNSPQRVNLRCSEFSRSDSYFFKFNFIYYPPPTHFLFTRFLPSFLTINNFHHFSLLSQTLKKFLTLSRKIKSIFAFIFPFIIKVTGLIPFLTLLIVLELNC
jgi:hypothetical protein